MSNRNDNLESFRILGQRLMEHYGDNRTVTVVSNLEPTFRDIVSIGAVLAFVAAPILVKQLEDVKCQTKIAII